MKEVRGKAAIVTSKLPQHTVLTSYNSTRHILCDCLFLEVVLHHYIVDLMT